MAHTFKAGDLVECLGEVDGQFTKGKIYTVADRVSPENDSIPIHVDDRGVGRNGWNARFFKLYMAAPVTEAPPQNIGPVRTETVTRKMIVPGTYGRVVVDDAAPSKAIVYIPYGWRTATELRAAAATLTQLADALDEQ